MKKEKKKRVTKKMKDEFMKEVFTPTHLSAKGKKHRGLDEKCKICFKQKFGNGMRVSIHISNPGVNKRIM